MRQYDRLAGKYVSIVLNIDGNLYDLVSEGQIIETNQYVYKLSRLAFDMGAKEVKHDYPMRWDT